MTALTSNEAAVKALQLFKSHCPVCRVLQPITATTTTSSDAALEATTAAVTSASTTLADNTSAGTSIASSSVMDHQPSCSTSTNIDTSANSILSCETDISKAIKDQLAKHTSNISNKSKDEPCLTKLDLNIFLETMNQCHTDQNFAKIRMLLWSVFSNEKALKNSFLPKKNVSLCVGENKVLYKKHVSNTYRKKEEVPPSISSEISCKEQLRSTESDLDKDIDSVEESNMSVSDAIDSSSENPCSKDNLPVSFSTLDYMQVDKNQDCKLMDTSMIEQPSNSEIVASSLNKETCDSVPADAVADVSDVSVTEAGPSAASALASSSTSAGETSSRYFSSDDILERTLPGCDQDKNVLGLPYVDESSRNFAFGYSVLKTNFYEPKIDFDELKEFYKQLNNIPDCEYVSTILNAQIQLLSDSLVMKHKASRSEFREDMKMVDIFIILLENPSFIADNDYTESVLEQMCEGLNLLGDQQKAAFVVYLAKNWKVERLQALLSVFHHLITIKLIAIDSTIPSHYDG